MQRKKKKYDQIRVQGNNNPEPLKPGMAPIIISQTVRGGLEVGDYMKAMKLAENVDWASRYKLLDICEEALTDAHLYAVIQKRKVAVLNSPIEFTRNGVVDEKIEEQIRSPWFQRLLSDILDIDQFGSTLLQFRREDKWLNYDKIPRKHYDPVKRIILRRQTDIIGESFDDFADLVMLGDPRDLGLLSKAALYVIYKRNAISDFAQFVELYGHPLKEGTYDAHDPDVRRKLAEDLFNAGGSTVLIHPNGTSLNLHDTTSKGATGELYKGFVTLCNDELSKLQLGNTLTTEVADKGTQALGTVHQAGEDKITRMSKQEVLNVLNYELTDVFINLGLDVTGGEFTFSTPQNKDLSARIQIDLQLQVMGLEIPADYLRETYGIPKPKRGEEVVSKANQKPEPTDTPEEKEKEPKPTKDPEEEKQSKSPEQTVDEKKERSLKNWVSNIFVRTPKPANFRGKMNALYRCAAKEPTSSFAFDETALKTALIRIYEKTFNVTHEIEPNLFNAIWDSLNLAVEEGVNLSTTPDLDFLEELKENNAVFSAFKAHNMQSEIVAELIDSKGQLKSFTQFLRDTDRMVDHHVNAWLKTEYDTAVIRAHQAAEWKQFEREKDVLPNLRWRQTTSLNPGADHQIYWNRIWSIEDAFWKDHRPGDRWNCKCSLIATDEPVTDNSGLSATVEKPSPGLGGNPAQTGEIFSKDHPYFTDTHKGADKAVTELLKTLNK